MKSAAQQPIIIIRKKRAHHAHHGGAWKVAYADFVTAMMAFFLVMWLSAQDSRIRDAIAGYFQEPGLLPHEQSNSLLAAGQGGIDNAGMPILNRKPAGMLEAEQRALVTAAEHIKQHMMQMSGFEGLRDQVELSITAEGMRIELVDKAGSSFFDSGSSVLRGESIAILTVIAEEIGKLPNEVILEGHTDSRQYPDARRYNNWDLSSDRANAARRVMLETGLQPGQLRGVRGLADTEIRIKEDPLDARNRRVSIVVKNTGSSGGQEPRSSGPQEPGSSGGKGPGSSGGQEPGSSGGSGSAAEPKPAAPPAATGRSGGGE